MVNYYHHYHLEILTMNFITIKVLLRIVIFNFSMNTSKHQNEANSKWLKALALNKIIYYVIETGRSNNVKSFKVKDLEEMYKYYESHVTRFAYNLVLQALFLEKH